MKQSPFVISMLLAASSAVKLERPANTEAVQYDAKNGVYRYAMPGPTEADVKLSQSSTDNGMLDASKDVVEQYSSIWEPEREIQAPKANGSGSNGWGDGIINIKKDAKSKDIGEPLYDP